MAFFVLGYDLGGEEKDYASLARELERLGAVRVVESFFFIEANTTAKALKAHFKQYFGPKDSVVIVKFASAPEFIRPKQEVYDWILSKTPKKIAKPKKP